MQILDGKGAWRGHLLAACKRRGWRAQVVDHPDDVCRARFGFTRLNPATLAEHRQIDTLMRAGCVMVQDQAQVDVYEDKTEQWRRWGHLMPETWLFDDVDQAMQFRPDAWPIMSKANEGASSVNVRPIYGRKAYEDHVRQAFGPGIEVDRCAGGAKTIQRGYLLLQRFVPHDRTYRVNVVGSRMAIFERYCYPDRPVAQTGNTQGVTDFTDLHCDLLDHAEAIAREIGSRWVALDILRDGDQWRLLETSLAWPWDLRKYADVPFIGGGLWGQMWDVLLEQLDAGVFGPSSR